MTNLIADNPPSGTVLVPVTKCKNFLLLIIEKLERTFQNQLTINDSSL